MKTFKRFVTEARQDWQDNIQLVDDVKQSSSYQNAVAVGFKDTTTDRIKRNASFTFVCPNPARTVHISKNGYVRIYSVGSRDPKHIGRVFPDGAKDVKDYSKMLDYMVENESKRMLRKKEAPMAVSTTTPNRGIKVNKWLLDVDYLEDESAQKSEFEASLKAELAANGLPMFASMNGPGEVVHVAAKDQEPGFSFVFFDDELESSDEQKAIGVIASVAVGFGFGKVHFAKEMNTLVFQVFK